MTSSAWGFEWGEAFWGSGTEWPGEPEVVEPGERDHTQTARDRLWKQLEGLPNWTAIMEVMGELLQEVESVLAQVSAGRHIMDAEGVQLDEIGAMIGLSRGAFADDDLYRLAIIVDARTQISSTTAPEILEVARRIAPDGALVRLQQLFPSSWHLTITDLSEVVFAALLVIMADLPSAGKNGLLVTYDSDNVAGWASTTPGAGPPLGAWGSTTGPTDSLAVWSNGALLGG